MTAGWHTFFYNSFDPAGFVSVDKPPLALWIQVASVAVWGFRPLAVLLPQVLEGVAAVAVAVAPGAASLGPGGGRARRPLPGPHADRGGGGSLREHRHRPRAGGAGRVLGAPAGRRARSARLAADRHGADRRRLQREDAGRLRRPADLRARVLARRGGAVAEAPRGPGPRRPRPGRGVAALDGRLRSHARRAASVRGQQPAELDDRPGGRSQRGRPLRAPLADRAHRAGRRGDGVAARGRPPAGRRDTRRRLRAALRARAGGPAAARGRPARRAGGVAAAAGPRRRGRGVAGRPPAAARPRAARPAPLDRLGVDLRGRLQLGGRDLPLLLSLDARAAARRAGRGRAGGPVAPLPRGRGCRGRARRRPARHRDVADLRARHRAAGGLRRVAAPAADLDPAGGGARGRRAPRAAAAPRRAPRGGRRPSASRSSSG